MFTIQKDIKKHAREFLTALKNFKYEKTEKGIFFPEAKVVLHGLYTHSVNGMDTRLDHNLIVDQGINYLLNTGLGNTAAITAWYLTIFAGGVTPANNWTAANFATNSSEITSTTNGFTQTARQVFSPGSATADELDNSASLAAFTIATTTQLNVTGAGLLSSSIRGDTSGLLLSATRFTATRTLNNGDVFNLGYSLAGTSS